MFPESDTLSLFQQLASCIAAADKQRFAVIAQILTEKPSIAFGASSDATATAIVNAQRDLARMLDSIRTEPYHSLARRLRDDCC
jgi:hypothetical protein